MPPESRIVPRFAAEPPQEGLPYGRWAQHLEEKLCPAFETLADEEGLGGVKEIVWYPDRSWQGQVYAPASAYTSDGFQLFGYVRSTASEMDVHADFTEQTAERNPRWTLDLCEHPIGTWRGAKGLKATMTLVWGRPLLGGGRLATAELGGVTVDQCELIEERFTLIAPDDYQHDLLEVGLWGAKGQQLALESLYEG